MEYTAEYNGTETQAKLQQFWEEAKTEIEVMKTDSNAFKSQDLPLARIKKIMKLDEDVKSMMISAEAPVLFAKAAEIFIREITMRAWMHTERNKRRTLQRNDITMAVSDGDTDQFDFLIDIVPREELKPATRRVKQEETTSGIPHVNMGQTVQLAAGQGAMPGATNAAAVQPIQYVLQLPYNGNNQMGGQPIQIQVLTPGYQAAQTTNDVSQGMQLIQMVQPQMQQAGTADHSGNAVSLSAQPQTIQIQQQPLMTPHQAQPILVTSSGMPVNETTMIQSHQDHHHQPHTIVIKQDESALENTPVTVPASQQQFFTIGGQTIMMQMPALQSVSHANSMDGATTVNSMPITVTSQQNNIASNVQVSLANIVTTSN